MASVNEHGALRQAFRGLKNNKKRGCLKIEIQK